MSCDEVVDHPLVREVVERDRSCGRRRRPAAAMSRGRALGAAWRGARPRAALVPLVGPAGVRWPLLQTSYRQSTMLPSASSAALGSHRHRRAVGLPGELVVAHPLHAHRAARHGARQQRGVERDVVGAVVAVAARALDVDAADRAPAPSSSTLASSPRSGKTPCAVRPDRQRAVVATRRARRTGRSRRAPW